MGIFMKKEFLMGVAAGIAFIAIVKRLPATVPGATQLQGLVSKVA